MRWFYEMWETVNGLKAEGVDIRALTAWAMFGTFGWNSLVTKPWGLYESGVFNLSSGKPRPTAIAHLLQSLAKHQVYDHPVLETAGWWKQEKRIAYPDEHIFTIKNPKPVPQCQPVLILGKPGMIGTGFNKICEERNIRCLLLDQTDLDLTNKETIEQIILEFNPWAIINTEEYAPIDQAEQNQEECFKLNSEVPSVLAEVCQKRSVKLLVFSSGFVFDGNKKNPYIESDFVAPLNVYGQSKAKAETSVLQHYPKALVVRTGICFSCWDHTSFVPAIFSRLKEAQQVTLARDATVSFTYVPDLAHASLDLLLDDECGIFHVSNQGQVTYADFARKLAGMAGFNTSLVKGVAASQLKQQASKPINMSMQSEKGVYLPPFESALQHYLDLMDYVYLPGEIAV